MGFLKKAEPTLHVVGFLEKEKCITKTKDSKTQITKFCFIYSFLIKGGMGGVSKLLTYLTEGGGGSENPRIVLLDKQIATYVYAI